MIFRGATSLREALEGVGPENRDFFGPWNGTSEASAIWAQKSPSIFALVNFSRLHVEKFRNVYFFLYCSCTILLDDSSFGYVT